MKLKNIAVFLVVCVLAFFFAGCNNGGTPTGKSPFVGGIVGLEMKFVEGEPPAEVYDNSTTPFQVNVRIENKGEFLAAKENVKISISGIDPKEFYNPIMVMNPDQDIDASYLDSSGKQVAGGIVYVVFPGFNFSGIVAGRESRTIRVESCYQYETSGQASVCIRKDPQATSETVCNVNEAKPTYSSGSPVQIENVQEEAAGSDSIRFSFDVVHQGTGAITVLGSGCSNKVSDKDRLWVEVNLGEYTPQISCSGITGGTANTGYARLDSMGRVNVRCKVVTTEAASDFEKTVSIKAAFEYKEHVDQILTIKPLR